MPGETRLYFPKYTLRLTVNVCFIMAAASKCAAVQIKSHFAKLPTPPCSVDQQEADFHQQSPDSRLWEGLVRGI